MRERAALLFAALLVASCAIPQARETIAPGYTLSAGGDGVVVGRFEGIDADGDPHWLAGSSIVSMASVVVHENTGQRYSVKSDTSGQLSGFGVALPAGRYRIHAATDSDLIAFVWIHFDVPAGGAAYIGTLRYTADYGWPTSRGVWTVVDDSQQTLAAFRARYPEVAPVEISLARISPN